MEEKLGVTDCAGDGAAAAQTPVPAAVAMGTEYERTTAAAEPNCDPSES